jgi:5-methylcytosine-specific restriction protein A
MMELNLPKTGDTLTNDRLCEIFQCSPQGGMRRSLKTNTLVLVSNHVDSVYHDRWIDGVLHYTGMGQKGDQSLDFMQNKTLAQSGSTDVAVHLFEVHVDGIYTYVGIVRLEGDPYTETQPDADGAMRAVWVFPLVVSQGKVPAVPVEALEIQSDRIAKRVRRLSDEEVKSRAEQARHRPGLRPTLANRFDRDPHVAEHAKRRAKGRCELCQSPAPFSNGNDEPYLETHHIVWLAKGGADTIENTVALCPNCHRKMHILDRSEDRKLLLLRLGQLECQPNAAL